MHDLPERSDIRGKVITPGALHTVRDTARLIAQRKGAACVFTGRANASKTHDTLARIDWERERDGHCDGDVDRAHGRTGQRWTGVPTPGPGTVTWPGIRQVARVRRWRESVLPGDAGKPGTETACPITSLGAEAASPRELLAPTEVTGPWCLPTAAGARDIENGAKTAGSRPATPNQSLFCLAWDRPAPAKWSLGDRARDSARKFEKNVKADSFLTPALDRRNQRHPVRGREGRNLPSSHPVELTDSWNSDSGKRGGGRERGIETRIRPRSSVRRSRGRNGPRGFRPALTICLAAPNSDQWPLACSMAPLHWKPETEWWSRQPAESRLGRTMLAAMERS